MEHRVIIDANTTDAKEDILAMLDNIDGKNQDISFLDSWLSLNLGTDNFAAWIDMDQEPIGVILVEKVELEGPKAYISFNWYKKGKSGNEKLVEKAEQWAKEKELNTMIFYTKRSPNTFIKKYGYELVRAVLKKEL